VIQNKSVLVTNISPQANEKTVSDFFSFCGRILRLTMRRGATASDPSTAIVLFETESAAKTALLLANALIIDRPISVQIHSEDPSLISGVPAPGETITEGSNIQHKEFSAPDHQRSTTSTISSMIAAGYVMGAETVQKARTYDEQHHLTDQLRAGAEELKKKVLAVDETYQLSAKASATANAITTAASDTIKGIDEQYQISATIGPKARAIDEKYQVSKTITDASAAASATLANLTASGKAWADWAMQQPVVANTTAAVKQEYNDIAKQTNEKIDVQMREKCLISGTDPSASAVRDSSSHVDGAPGTPPVPAPAPANPPAATGDVKLA
jgi:hypothetical protein